MLLLRRAALPLTAIAPASLRGLNLARSLTVRPPPPRLVATTPQVRNNVEAGVLEPALSKLKMIQFATEAAITVLRIDDLITLAPSQDDNE